MDEYSKLRTLYDRLKREIEEDRRMESERLAELVIARVREALDELRIDADVVPRQSGNKVARKRALPKYWNPKTGQTWSGNGRPPKWLAGKNHERFLIEKDAETDIGTARRAPESPSEDRD
ncbi:H-NS histone family protein [Burkholderia sp. BCC0397]|uniref:H-NS histone family protein n=1 Tax=Burkholderia sp. BCC0397 TaxID=486876 RepID=UPI00158BB24E|nr:H-NS histone family protein [Burkholderia sp. BCC0397]